MLYWTTLLDVVICITRHNKQQLNAVQRAIKEYVKVIEYPGFIVNIQGYYE